MAFLRPVDKRFPVCAEFMEWGPRWEWLTDPDTGMWIPRGSKVGLLGQHRGVDFACPAGSPVVAMSNGMIVRTAQASGSGLFIIQLAECMGFDSWWIRYSHLKRVLVKVGDLVNRGNLIAMTGQSGNVDRPSLHVDLMDPTHQYRPIPLED